jgi:DNA-binding IclR family transcriptional regulator
MSTKYKAPIVKKAFSILKLLSKSDAGMTVSDLARQLPISKSTVFGIVSALDDVGAVSRDEGTKRYSLGPTLFELGRAVEAQIDLKDLARPFIQELMRETQESVFLGARSGNTVTILDIVESTKDLKITAPVGTRIPLLAGAIGKVFLASLPADQAGRWIRAKKLRRFTANTITNATRFLQEVERARLEGYALDDEEYISGVRAVAAPITNGGSRISAIWVVGFTPSMSAEHMRRIAKETKRTAGAIGRSMLERKT